MVRGADQGAERSGVDGIAMLELFRQLDVTVSRNDCTPEARCIGRA